MSKFVSGLVLGLGRKVAYEIINDVKKEQDIKLAPRTPQVFKDIVNFKVGASFNTTCSRLLQIIYELHKEFKRNPNKTQEYDKYLKFIDEALPFLEMQITNDNHRNQFRNINILFDETKNAIL